MPKSLRQRVDDAFAGEGSEPDPTRNDAIEYCKYLREAWVNVSASLNRTVLAMVAVAAVFELFAMNSVETVTLAGFQFSNIATVQAFLPVVIAYLYLEVFLLYGRYGETGLLHSLCMRRAYPNLEANDLQLWLAPPSRALLSQSGLGSSAIDTRTERFVGHMLAFIAKGSLVLPLAFEVYAFWILFRHATNIIFVWIAFTLTTILIAAALIAWAIRNREHRFLF
jgi:hypothetical protein